VCVEVGGEQADRGEHAVADLFDETTQDHAGEAGSMCLQLRRGLRLVLLEPAGHEQADRQRGPEHVGVRAARIRGEPDRPL
jgi:hypothetical protein